MTDWPRFTCRQSFGLVSVQNVSTPHRVRDGTKTRLWSGLAGCEDFFVFAQLLRCAP